MGEGRVIGLTGLVLGWLGCCWPALGVIPPAIITGNGDGIPTVKVFTPGGATQGGFLAYSPSFTGGVRVAAGDVNGDGRPDIITSAGLGAPGGHVKAFSGQDLGELLNFLPYSPSFAGGVFVAAGDVNGDGRADIITGTDAGVPGHVQAFSGSGLTSLASFLPYGAFTGGVRVAAGDVTGDGKADIITGAGGGGGHVQVFNGTTLAVARSFFPFGGYTGGVFVAGGDVSGDGLADLVVATDSAVPHVKVFSGADNSELYSFLAYDGGFTGGVRVAAGDVNGDGRADIITGTGAGAAAHVKVFSGSDLSLLGSFFADSPSFTGGVYVAAAVPEPAAMAALGLVMVGLFRRCRKSSAIRA